MKRSCLIGLFAIAFLAVGIVQSFLHQTQAGCSAGVVSKAGHLQSSLVKLWLNIKFGRSLTNNCSKDRNLI